MNHGSQNIQQDGREGEDPEEAQGLGKKSGEGPVESLAEEWRPVVGYEGCYEVSNLGTIRSTVREQPHGLGGTMRRLRSRIIRPWINGKGYLYVAFSMNGVVTHSSVHRAVCLAFHAKFNGVVVNHKDGNKLNNSAANLEWSTYGENNAHAYRTGLKPPVVNRGEKAGGARLTNALVIQIRERTASGETFTQIADGLKISRSTVWRAATGRTWTHL